MFTSAEIGVLSFSTAVVTVGKRHTRRKHHRNRRFSFLVVYRERYVVGVFLSICSSTLLRNLNGTKIYHACITAWMGGEEDIWRERFLFTKALPFRFCSYHNYTTLYLGLGRVLKDPFGVYVLLPLDGWNPAI